VPGLRPTVAIELQRRRGRRRDLQGVVHVAGRTAKEVVIWLEAPAAPPSPGRVTATLDQRNMQFVPRVLAVRVGTQVRMPNSDRLLHNVFSFHDGKVFDLGLYPVGTRESSGSTSRA
jgi:plastocyanin